MLSSEFKVGDRVFCISAYEDKDEAVNMLGTVRAVRSSGDVGVEFDEHIEGHDLSGNCEYGYGWWFNSGSVDECLEHFHEESDNSIEIDEEAWDKFIRAWTQ